MKSEIVYALNESPDKRYVTVRELKKLVNKLDNDDGIVLVASGGNFLVIDELEVDSDRDLLIRANTEYV